MECCPSKIEVWKPIPGYEGLYEASNQGRIRTVEGKITSCAKYPKRVWTQRVMKLKWKERKGHTGKYDARVCLWKDGVEKTYLVSRLVAMSFLPCPFDKLTVNHIDGNPSNNNIENLEWVTRAENNRLGFETGLFNASQKPIILTNVNTLEDLRFSSMSEADRFMKRKPGYTSEKIARCNFCYDASGNKYTARLESDGDVPS